MARALVLPALFACVALVVRAEAAPKLGVATPVEDPGHVGLGRWFSALKSARDGNGVARALHYGDSTIANDGLAKTVRARLVERFGDAGPGFVTAAFHPGTHIRSDVSFTRRGSWTLRSILNGGGGGRYGLGGVVGVMTPGASVTLGAIDDTKAPRPQTRLELWFQAGVGYGTFIATVDGREVTRTPAVAAETEDRRFTLDVPEGYASVTVKAEGGPVPMYGAVLEKAAGATWEALGVIGVGSKSFTTYARDHLAVQMRERAPDLVVVQIGGNEVGYPSLTDGSGKAYVPIFDAALTTILAGAPDASCLVVTPIDQGYVDAVDGLAKSKPGMKNLVARQREVALAHGCAFWNARAAMGGEGSAAKWGNTAGIGTGDYVHVTGYGLSIVGHLLADALFGAYGEWEAGR